MTLKHLHHKLVLYILTCAIFLASIAAALSYNAEFEHSQEQAELIFSEMLGAVEHSAASAAYNRDTEAANDIIIGLLSNDVIYKVSIKSGGLVVAEKEKTRQPQNSSQLIRVLYSPFVKQQLIGQLVIYLDTQSIIINARGVAYTSAGIILLLTALTTIILLLLVHFYLSRPLLKISNTVHAIKEGDNSLIPQLDSHKDDELGRLVDDINDLLQDQEIKLTQEQRLRKSIQHMEQQLRNIFDSSSAGLFLLDNDGYLISYNPTLLKVMHCENQPALTFTEEDFASLFINEKSKFQRMLNDALLSEELQSQDFSLKQDQASSAWVHCLLSKVTSETGKERIEGVIFDVSKRVKNEQAIKHKADHDSLTGLLLREAARDRLEHHMLSSEELAVSVILLDLDGFKQANDTYGHDVGDKVLVKTASRLSACVRSGDLVCRLGGDEFLIIVLDSNSSDIALAIAEKIITNIQFPMPIDSSLSVQVGVSVGVAIAPGHGEHFDDLVKSADEAMYEVKRQGKNGYGIKIAANQIKVKSF